MQSLEEKVSPRSDYYVYVPTALARKLYLYPLHVGYFIYEPGYCIRRDRFDSFLIMYIVRGTVDIVSESSACRAEEGEFVLLDCYRPTNTEVMMNGRLPGFILTVPWQGNIIRRSAHSTAMY